MIGIQKTRLVEGIQAILVEELQQGRLPSSKEFQMKLTEFLQSNLLHRPKYQFEKVQVGEVVGSEFYNQVITHILYDLITLYQNTFAIHKELEGKFDFFEIERNRLEYEIRKLENELRERIALYGKTGYLASIFDVFDDQSKIEQEENIIIDSKKHEVHLLEHKNASLALQMDGKISFKSLRDDLFTKISLIGKPENALSPFSNETFQELWLSNEKSSAEGYFEYAFKTSELINRIDVELQTIKACDVWIEYTSDMYNYFHLKPEQIVTTDKYAVFNFAPLNILLFRIHIKKKEPDKQSVTESGTQYEYLFGAKRIQAYRMSYPKEGFFITKELTPNLDSFAVGKVSLVTEEIIPDGTSISYELQLEGDDSWRSISPLNREVTNEPKVLDFQQITYNAPQVLKVKDNTLESELVTLRANGIRFYSIGTIEKKNIIPQSEKLYLGRNAWMIKELAVDHGTVHFPTLDDWNHVQGTTTNIQTIDPSEKGLLLKDRNFTEHTQLYYSISLYASEKQHVFTAIPSSTEPIAIFLNGQKIYEGIPSSQNSINYKLENGWNQLVVLAYIQNVGVGTTSSIDLGFNPIEKALNCYAIPQSLQKVSLFDLRYNVKSNDWGFYALLEEEDKVHVVVNHALPGILYDFYYNYTTDTSKKKIKLRATFRQNNTNSIYTTPILKRYTLQFS